MAWNLIESYLRTSKMAASGHLKSSIWIWNGQKCHRKLISDIQNARSIWNGQKCDPKWFSDIQNGRRKKKLYRSEMARIAIKSEFRTSKIAAGSHFVKNVQRKKWRIDLKWPEMRLKVNFGNPKWPIDLKWPEMGSKVKFEHPKWPTSAILLKISKKI